MPFVIDLGGTVNDDSYGALKEITREAANAAGPRLRWEKLDWAARVQRRMRGREGADDGVAGDANASERVPVELLRGPWEGRVDGSEIGGSG